MNGKLPQVTITKEMLDAGINLIDKVKVNRTQASEIDTLTGILGEFAFAQYYYGDWKKNRVTKNKGEVDYGDIEIKASAFPFNNHLNLLVREDYAKRRKPPFYIQIIISVEDPQANNIKPGTKAFICGFATSDEVDAAPKRDVGSKFGGSGGYKCHYIPIGALHPMDTFREEHQNSH
jgi:hypothetical protein